MPDSTYSALYKPEGTHGVRMLWLSELSMRDSIAWLFYVHNKK